MGQYTGSTVCEYAVHLTMSSMIRTCLNMHLNQFMSAVLQMLMLVNIFFSIWVLALQLFCN